MDEAALPLLDRVSASSSSSSSSSRTLFRTAGLLRLWRGVSESLPLSRLSSIVNFFDKRRHKDLLVLLTGQRESDEVDQTQRKR